MPTLAAACAAHVLTHGPCSSEEVHRALVEQGTTSARTDSSVRTALRGSRQVVELPDGRYESRLRVLRGSLLTVRARSRLADDVLWIHDDLAPLVQLLLVGPVPLRSGGQVSLGTGPVRTLRGPIGWLPRVEPGALVGLRWDGDALDVTVVEDAPGMQDPHAQRARLVLEQHRRALAGHRVPADLADVVLSALGEVPDLLARPLPPLSEVLATTAFPGSGVSRWTLPEGDWELQDAAPVVLRLPSRVVGEIERRADLLGESPSEHASVLLSAAIDRIGAVSRVGGRRATWESAYEDRYDGYDRYDRYNPDDDLGGTVVRPTRWRV